MQIAKDQDHNTTLIHIHQTHNHVQYKYSYVITIYAVKSFKKFQVSQY